MNRLVVLPFLIGCLFMAGADAQPEPSRAPVPVPVRPIAEVSTWERLQIALTRAFIPGVKVLAPLYAYDIALACDERYEITQHEGSAALVAISAGAEASYYATVADAVEAARDQGLCDSGAKWQFATTNPLDGDVEEAGRYISRDVELVEEAVRWEPNRR